MGVAGGLAGFGVGVALGPGPEAGGMYGLEQFASGVVGAGWGLGGGAAVGGVTGWIIGLRRRRET